VPLPTTSIPSGVITDSLVSSNCAIATPYSLIDSVSCCLAFILANIISAAFSAFFYALFSTTERAVVACSYCSSA